MKKLLTIIIMTTCLLFLCSCCYPHQWIEANCTAPRTCEKCGATEGQPLEHTWAEATCLFPKTCIICGSTEGQPLEHTWAEATCLSPKTCLICGSTDGEKSDHSWEPAQITEPTCTAPGTSVSKCSICGTHSTSLIKPSGHIFDEEWNQCVLTKTCSICGYKNESVVHNWAFPSGYYITSCNYELKKLYGIIKCTRCGEEKDSYLRLDDSEFETLFCSWLDIENCYINYEDLARFPEENNNYVAKFTGYILQDCGNQRYRISAYDRYNNPIMVEMIGELTNGRLLEDDYVTVYGKPDLLYTYESISGATITIPKFTAYYIRRN